jgi:hypothetical protein
MQSYRHCSTSNERADAPLYDGVLKSQNVLRFGRSRVFDGVSYGPQILKVASGESLKTLITTEFLNELSLRSTVGFPALRSRFALSISSSIGREG